jgi:predicted RNase H-like nuclease (RuvC/YqgF family)
MITQTVIATGPLPLTEANKILSAEVDRLIEENRQLKADIERTKTTLNALTERLSEYLERLRNI